MKNKIPFLSKFFFIGLFVFPLFKENISSFFLIVLSFLVVLNSFINKKTLFLSKEVFVYTIPFFIILLTNIFATNSDFDANSVKKALLFFVFPIVFTNLPKEYFKNLDPYLYLFKYVCLIICFFYISGFLLHYSFMDFFIERFNESPFRKYVYKEVTFFQIHPTYFSVFLNFCVAHSIVMYIKEKKLLNSFLFVFFTIMILLLSSKVVIIINIATIIYLLLNKTNVKRIYLFTSCVIFIIGVFALPGIKSRFTETFRDFNNPPVGEFYNSTNVRKSVITCSLDILNQNYIRGIGFSNIQKELNACYASKYNSDFFKKRDYLTHNYFLYIFIGSGILGFLFFLAYIIYITKKCLIIGNPLLYVAFFSCIILMFFEDFLYRHYGCFFFNLIVLSYINSFEVLKNKT